MTIINYRTLADFRHMKRRERKKLGMRGSSHDRHLITETEGTHSLDYGGLPSACIRPVRVV